MVRENCLEYLNEILLHWDLSERDSNILDNIGDAIKLGLEEASVRGREVAQIAYLNFRRLSVKRADKIKTNLSTLLQNKLSKAEIHTEEQWSKQLFEDSACHSIIENRMSVVDEQSSSTLLLRSPKPPPHEVAANQIQALVRGVVSRRKSSFLSSQKKMLFSEGYGEHSSTFSGNATFQDVGEENEKLISNFCLKKSCTEESNRWNVKEDSRKKKFGGNGDGINKMLKTSISMDKAIDINSNDIRVKTTTINTLLKLKISRLLSLLHEQMEIADTMEHSELSMFELDGFIEALRGISTREYSMVSNFKTRVENTHKM